VREDLSRPAVRLVVETLPPLVLDDVALRVKLGEVERIEQKPIRSDSSQSTVSR
jgi:hypothetical protein